jgi:hypothetical protein
MLRAARLQLPLPEDLPGQHHHPLRAEGMRSLRPDLYVNSSPFLTNPSN